MRQRLSVAALLLSLHAVASGAALPTGFTETSVATGLQNATAIGIAPDGRIFVCEQAGALRVVKNGALLPAPFGTLTVNSIGERGLLGVAFDPDFLNNRFVYVYYTATAPTIHNRISRLTANGDVAVPHSEVVLLDLPTVNASNHNGGAIHFGRDGKLYAAVGENAVTANSQTLSNPLGKMLRINSDGTIPSDNPFFGSTTGNNRAIWALGLRNPFTFGVHQTSGRIFINDVGQNTFEEINDGIAGANYGWPTTEGPTSNPSFVSPLHFYGRDSGCAIAGGAFYAPEIRQFPSQYVESYFFADLCFGWIRRLPGAAPPETGFATGISQPVDLRVAHDGSLYYLARGTGTLVRVRWNGRLAGDVNGDGDTTSADVFYLINHFQGGGPPPAAGRGDVNADGLVNSADLTYLVNYLYARGPTPV